MHTVDHIPAGTKPPDVSQAATYAVHLTAAQIFGFAGLVRRLGQAYGPDADRALRQDLVDALNAFVGLLPEPPEEDGDAYLAAVRAGQLPDWGMDGQPLTETPEQLADRIRGGISGGTAPWRRQAIKASRGWPVRRG